jgi:transposase
MAGGRPTKLNDEVKDKLVAAIAQGNYYEAACGYVGIDYRTFRNWMTEGEQATDGIYFQFFHAIKKAEAHAELKMVQEWQKHTPNNWQAIATFMERRYPDRWGRKDRTQVEHSGGVTINFIDPAKRGKDDKF